MHPPRQGALVAKKVGAIPLGLFVHRDYLARKRTPTPVEGLVGHDVIGPDRARGELRMATELHPAQLALIRAGLGIGVVHSPIGLADSSLQPVMPETTVMTYNTWIVTYEDLRDVPRVRAMFDHLVADSLTTPATR